MPPPPINRDYQRLESPPYLYGDWYGYREEAGGRTEASATESGHWHKVKDYDQALWNILNALEDGIDRVNISSTGEMILLSAVGDAVDVVSSEDSGLTALMTERGEFHTDEDDERIATWKSALRTLYPWWTDALDSMVIEPAIPADTENYARPPQLNPSMLALVVQAHNATLDIAQGAPKFYESRDEADAEIEAQQIAATHEVDYRQGWYVILKKESLGPNAYRTESEVEAAMRLKADPYYVEGDPLIEHPYEWVWDWDKGVYRIIERADEPPTFASYEDALAWIVTRAWLDTHEVVPISPTDGGEPQGFMIGVKEDAIDGVYATAEAAQKILDDLIQAGINVEGREVLPQAINGNLTDKFIIGIPETDAGFASSALAEEAVAAGAYGPPRRTRIEEEDGRWYVHVYHRPEGEFESEAAANAYIAEHGREEKSEAVRTDLGWWALEDIEERPSGLFASKQDANQYLSNERLSEEYEAFRDITTGDWGVREIPDRRLSIDELIAEAFVSEDYQRALDLSILQEDPLGLDRLDAAMKYARSPGDYFTILKMARGEIPVGPIPRSQIYDLGIFGLDGEPMAPSVQQGVGLEGTSDVTTDVPTDGTVVEEEPIDRTLISTTTGYDPYRDPDYDPRNIPTFATQVANALTEGGQELGGAGYPTGAAGVGKGRFDPTSTYKSDPFANPLLPPTTFGAEGPKRTFSKGMGEAPTEKFLNPNAGNMARWEAKI